jgi:protein subunit release factor B
VSISAVIDRRYSRPVWGRDSIRGHSCNSCRKFAGGGGAGGGYNNGVGAFPVSIEKEAQLAQRMAGLGVSEADIDESFVRSGGHGGQNVNKTSTCVMLTHRPTGLQVKCQETRQQGLNRFIARRLLLDKIEARKNGFIAARRAEIERIRRQKRKRSRRAKDKMLANKSHHADKKDLRRRIGAE